MHEDCIILSETANDLQMTDVPTNEDPFQCALEGTLYARRVDKKLSDVLNIGIARVRCLEIDEIGIEITPVLRFVGKLEIRIEDVVVELV